MKTAKSVVWIAMLLLSVPFYACADWTDLPLAPDARIVYVSAAGRDTNSGLSESEPKATITAGYELLRDGYGDHLLLRRGEPPFILSGPIGWQKSGASAQYPMVFGAYGIGAPPVIDRGNGRAITVSPGYESANTVRHVAIVGLHFYASQRDWTQLGFDPAGSSDEPAIRLEGIHTTAPQVVENLLIEDCKIAYFGAGITMVMDGPDIDGVDTFRERTDSFRNVRLNRNVIVDTYVTSGHATGVYAAHVTGIVLEENLIDGVQRAPVSGVVETSLNHSVYIQSTSRNATLRNNIFARAFDGGMMRPGGLYEGNVTADTAVGTHQGYMFETGTAPAIPEGVEALVIGNAFLNFHPFTNPKIDSLRNGVQAGNIRSGAIAGNLILSGLLLSEPHSVSGPHRHSGVYLIGNRPPDPSMPDEDDPQFGVDNLAVARNFVVGLRGLYNTGNKIRTVFVHNNQFQSPEEIVSLNNFHPEDPEDPDEYRFEDNAYHSDAAPDQWFSTDEMMYNFEGWHDLTGERELVISSPQTPSTTPDIASYHAEILGRTGSLDAFLNEAREQSRQNWRPEYTARPVITYLRDRLGLLSREAPSLTPHMRRLIQRELELQAEERRRKLAPSTATLPFPPNLRAK